MTLLIKPNEQNQTCLNSAMAGKSCSKANLLVKPNEQNQTCLNSAMAGKSCAKANLLVKPNEQNQTCLNSAMAGKSCAKANLLNKPNEQNQTRLNYAMAEKSCATANYYHILFAAILLLFGCDRIYPNKLTPKEVEIDASEQTLEFRTTRKIDSFHVSSTESNSECKGGYAKDLDGILFHDGGWFSMRINTNDLDSCNVIIFKINKNESKEKRKIFFTVFGDLHFSRPHGTIIQNAQ